MTPVRMVETWTGVEPKVWTRSTGFLPCGTPLKAVTVTVSVKTVSPTGISTVALPLPTIAFGHIPFAWSVVVFCSFPLVQVGMPCV